MATQRPERDARRGSATSSAATTTETRFVSRENSVLATKPRLLPDAAPKAVM